MLSRKFLDLAYYFFRILWLPHVAREDDGSGTVIVTIGTVGTVSLGLLEKIFRWRLNELALVLAGGTT